MALTERLYIESATSLNDRLTRVCQIIEALELQMLNVGTGNSDVEEYSLNDGQVQIRTRYRSTSEIVKGIESFEALKQMLLNKLNGRGFVLRPARGLV